MEVITGKLVVNAGEYVFIKPPFYGTGYVKMSLKNLYFSGPMSLSIVSSDEDNGVEFFTATEGGALLGFDFILTEDHYLKVANISAADKLEVYYDGMIIEW